MKTKYEIIEIDNIEITVDVSLLIKCNELSLNATEMAKPYNKKVQDYTRLDSTQKYIEAIEKRYGLSRNEIVMTKRGGKYQGTWFTKKLSIDFARWLSPDFAVELDEWLFEKLKEEQSRKNARLEARTGYLPLTKAIMEQHDPAKFYHFSTEADLINRIVLGMSAKKFKEANRVDSVRDACSASDIHYIDKIQRMNTTLVELGVGYNERKETLSNHYRNEQKKIGEM